MKFRRSRKTTTWVRYKHWINFWLKMSELPQHHLVQLQQQKTINQLLVSDNNIQNKINNKFRDWSSSSISN